MKWLLVFFLLLCTPAHARFAPADLDAVAFAPKPGARLPLDLPILANGQLTTLRHILAQKPALLLPVDFRCRVTCGPALSIVSEALAGVPLTAGADYRVLLLGLNTDATSEETRNFVEQRVGSSALRAAITRLRATPATLSKFTEALGYRYRYDESTQSFAHPLGAVTLTAEGAVSRLLSPLALGPNDLRLALLEAGQGRIGSWVTRLTLLCYGFDPAHGVYTSRIVSILRGSAMALLVALGAWLVWISRRSRKHEGLAS